MTTESHYVGTAASQMMRVHVPAEVHEFLRAMANAHAMDELLYFLEKPGKWEGEFEVWREAGRPQDDADAGWRPFTDYLDAR